MTTFQLYQYRGLVTEVYDGDTCTVDIDLGFKIHFTEVVRLMGINAPELRGSERPAGLVSRDRLREKVLKQPIYIETVKDSKEKYGRYLGTLFLQLPDGSFENINEWLVAQGLAVYQEY